MQKLFFFVKGGSVYEDQVRPWFVDVIVASSLSYGLINRESRTLQRPTGRASDC